MIFEYVKPSVEVINFQALEALATAQEKREARDGDNTGGDPSVNLGSMPGFNEGVEEW